MILLLGASGYVGTAFRELLEERGIAYKAVSRADSDGYSGPRLVEIIKESGATFLINAAGYTGKPNVDACEDNRFECMTANAFMPIWVGKACETAGIPWGHVSSGCIYNGYTADKQGFSETNRPNFTFDDEIHSYYSGTKALGEEMIDGDCYIWRLRIPFDHRNGPRNYITKLLTYDTLLDAENSISHLGDFVKSCLACWVTKAPFGTYNLTNPGSVTTRQVVELIQKHLKPDKEFKFFESEAAFLKTAKAPRSNCVLNTDKAQSAGFGMRPVLEALEDALTNWES